MKKTTTINLGGYVFHIDDDAFDTLSEYIHSIEYHLNDMPEKKEIISDIEMRMAELFRERLHDYRNVVTINDVEEIIKILGQPKDFNTESSGGKSYQNESFSGGQHYYYERRYRRMYRDPDNRVLGGVCSGLSLYFGIDPVILRVVFILTAFGAAGLIVYIILWIVLPEANTTAQKLEMRGEPVTINNITGFIKDEFEHIKKGFTKGSYKYSK